MKDNSNNTAEYLQLGGTNRYHKHRAAGGKYNKKLHILPELKSNDFYRISDVNGLTI